MNTHESYVSLETAKLLKEAGFDWGCDFFYGLDVRYRGKSIGEYKEYELKAKGKGSKIEYVDGGMVYNFYHSNKEGEDYGGYSRPTLDVAQRWLREVKGLHICVKADAASINCKYFVTVIISDTKWGNVQDENKKTILFNTYEEAQEAGIQKCLTLLLNEDK